MSSINNAGFAKYVIELDVIGIEKAKMLETQLKSTSVSLTNMAKGPLGSVNSSFKQLTGTMEGGVTPLGNFNKQVGAMPANWDKTATSIDKASSKTLGFTKRLGEGMRANKGLVFGLAGLSSAAAEGAGMLSMYGDAVEQNKEAQEALTEAQADSTTSTQDMARAEQDAAKAKKWLGMTTRNLVLSQMDQVFFGTMVISQLSEMGLGAGKLRGAFSSLTKVGGALKAALGIAPVASAASVSLDALGASSVASSAGMNTAAASAKGLAIAIGTIAAPLIAAKGAFDIIPKVQEFQQAQKTIDNLDTTIREKNLARKKQIETLLTPFDITNLNSWATTITRALNPESEGKLRKELADINALLAKNSPELDKTVTGILKVADATSTAETRMKTFNDSMVVHVATVKEMTPLAHEIINWLDQSKVGWQDMTAIVNDHVAAMLAEGKISEYEANILMNLVTPAVEKLIEVKKTGIATQTLYSKTLADGTKVWMTYDQAMEHDLGTVDQQLQKARDLDAQKKLVHGTLADGTPVWMTYDQAMAQNLGTVDEQLQKARDLDAAKKKVQITLADGTKVWGTQDQAMEMNLGTVDEQLQKARDLDAAKKRVQTTLADGTVVWATQDQIMEKNLGTVDEQLEKARQAGKTYASWTKQLDNASHSQKMFDDGTKAGVNQLSQFTDGLISGERQSAIFRTGLEEIIHRLHPLVDTSRLTTQQLQALAEKGFKNAGDAAVEARQKWESYTQSIKLGGGIFGGVINAEDSKAFKEAWKELDLGDVPKKLRDDLKDAVKEAGNLSEEALELTTSIEGLNISMDSLTEKQVGKWVGKITDEFRDWANEMGGAEQRIANVPGLLEAVEESAKTNGELWQKFTEIMQDSNVEWDEGEELIAMFNKTSGKTPGNIDAITKSTKGLQQAQSDWVKSQAFKTTLEAWKVLSQGGIIKIPTSPNDPTKTLSENTGKLVTSTDNLKTAVDTNTTAIKGGIKLVFGGGGVLPDFPDGSKPGNNPLDPDGGGGGRGYEILTIFQGQEVNTVFDKLALFGEGLIKVTVKAQALQTGLANLAIQGSNSMTILADQSSIQMSGIENNFSVGYVAAGHLQEGVANLANEGSNSLSMLANSSSDNMDGMENNLNVGYESAGHLQTGLANLANEGSNSLSQLAKSSSKNMNGLVNNMEAGEKAVKSLKSAIESLKDKTVTVRYKQVGAPQSKGGVYSFAQGGTVSAAGGLTTVSQPTHFIYGDNPGNHETLAFIPHNNPTPIMDRLEKMFGSKGNGGAQLSQNITLNIKGTDIVNSMKIDKKIRTTIGDKRDRFGT